MYTQCNFYLKKCAHSAFFFLAVLALLNCSKFQKSQSEFPRAEVKDYNGVPTLFINGQPNAGMTYMTYNPKEKHYKQFGEIGVDLASFQTSANYNLYWFDPPVWVSRDSFDFTLLDEEMEMIVRAHPDVWIFPRVYLWSPPWWDEENPDELMVYSDGKKIQQIWANIPPKRKATLPAWSSEKWRKDTAYCLRKFIEHIESQSYGKRVIGYHLASGSTEEWFYWLCTTHFLDYSPSQVRAFREWLRKKYQTEDNLRSAWNKTTVSFESAAIPSDTERINTELFFFRDPQKSRNVIDYHQFHAELVAETIAYFARVVKEATNRERLVGAFYGYTFELGGRSNFLVGAGHLAFRKLLECPDVDFFTSPSSYGFRSIGVGHSALMCALESVKIHEKLWFDENDYRTHLLSPNAGYGRTSDLKASESIQIRQVANEITHGIAAWWFDMGAGWYDENQFMNVLQKLNSIAERSIQFNRSSVAQIAVVVDEHSLLYTELDNRLIRPLLYTQRLEIGRIGAPVDYLLMDDIGRARDYTMYIFLNAFHVSSEQKKEIDRLPARGTKAILWLYAPGFAGETLDVTGIKNLTGFSINYIPDSTALEVSLTDKGKEVLSVSESDVKYGTEKKVGPIFYGEDPEAEVLGTIIANGKPGLICKMVNGIQNYYSAAPNVASAVVRGIAEKSGVHVYTKENDSFYANGKFLALHTNKGGQRTVRFPELTDVYDLYNDKVIATQVSQINVDIPDTHTVFYFLGSETEWKK